MDGVTSRFDLGKSFDPLDEFRVENNIRTLGTRSAQLPHRELRAHCMCIVAYNCLQIGATTSDAPAAGLRLARRCSISSTARSDAGPGEKISDECLFATSQNEVKSRQSRGLRRGLIPRRPGQRSRQDELVDRGAGDGAGTPAGSLSERLNRATFVTHTDQWPMPSCLTTAKQPNECNYDEPPRPIRRPP